MLKDALAIVNGQGIYLGGLISYRNIKSKMANPHFNNRK